MNKDLEFFARESLKNDIANLPEENHMLFKRMYSPGNLDRDINEVIDLMPIERLDWAMQQVSNTLKRHSNG